MELRTEAGEEKADLRRRLREVFDRCVKPTEDYRFPVVTLGPDTSLEAVCSIFETLNRTGVRLSVFDLLAARFYARGLDLRRLWERTGKSRRSSTTLTSTTTTYFNPSRFEPEGRSNEEMSFA